MRERLRCEFSLIRYVPDVVKGEFANIGVVLRDDRGKTAVRFTRNWGRVRCLDAGVDTELLESLESEMVAVLEGAGTLGNGQPLLEVLGESLSNSVQMTEMKATLAESLPAEMEQLLRMYVEPLKAGRAVKERRTGRGAIQQQMRTEFERAGVWGLLRKKIAAAQYTQPGDPLKIDCGYKNGRLRLFQAVSLENDAESAKGLAYSTDALRKGVSRLEDVELEMTAVIEPIAAVGDLELYAFGVRAMEQEQIRVLTVADLGRVAETARRELLG